ncbi:hypothetical protein CLOSTASPAR_01564 [[Clostridium] asparagiforme DSM 15981]|uniref:Uncharacterized protein n=1 Tax=[Clostridium] asparagiforme DSM 15981 TaxID=518636 RepID=C0CX43_9FIRM|nr:hypothetical protein CLOSTASPAR_01564 [[Clostridium] asparagiforme DSM 15981]
MKVASKKLRIRNKNVENPLTNCVYATIMKKKKYFDYNIPQKLRIRNKK